MPTPNPEPDIDRLSALYHYGVLDAPNDPFLDAVARKLAVAFADMAVRIVLVDDHRLWVAAAAGRDLAERGKQGSLAGTAIEQMEPLVVDDLAQDGRFAGSPSVVDLPRLRAYGAVALRTEEGYAIGVLAVSDTIARSFAPEHLALLERGAARVMTHLETRRASRLDPASRAMSGTSFREQVAALAGVATRHRSNLSLLAIDMRALRRLVPGSGSDFGRLVLDRVSGLGRRSLRRLDSLGRFGESTFLALLPDTDEAGARALGRRILGGIAQGPTLSAAAEHGASTCGIGVATFRVGLEDADHLIARAICDCRRPWANGAEPLGRTPQVA